MVSHTCLYSLYSELSFLLLNNPHHNGDSEVGGQSIHSYSSLETDTTYPSYTNSYVTDSSSSDLKLHEKINELNCLLVDEQRKTAQLTRELVSTKQELTHARKELAALRKPMDISTNHQDPVVRPGTLFPLDQHQRYNYRLPSPAKVDGMYLSSSQSDNLSMRSANSTTSVNSSSSVGNNFSRPHMQSFV